MLLGDHPENKPIENVSALFQDYPILGVRIGRGGNRLIYRVNHPGNLVSNTFILYESH
jgi:hypothetical protein